MNELWAQSRAGSHAGRGFHYQDAVAAHFAVLGIVGDLDVRRIVPEGLDDISLDLGDGWFHVQAKSRRDHRGPFQVADLADVWRHLGQRLQRDPESRVGLVVERELPGWVTELSLTLADVLAAPQMAQLAGALGPGVDVERFAARCHVMVAAEPARSALGSLAAFLERPAGACVAHVDRLRQRLVETSDQNGTRSWADASLLTAHDLVQLIEAVDSSVDPSALDEAVRTGTAELVDFSTPVDTASFPHGVNVVPGHVVAGLPHRRAELQAGLARGLDDRGLGLIAGPSGSGKSALLWMHAFESRHTIRWYRIRQIDVGDVPAVVRMVRAQQAAGARMGVAVDDVGQAHTVGFDRLASELSHLPNVVLLGACREEDLPMIGSEADAVIVRPTLDDAFAERLWLEARDDGRTTWAGWREPLALAQGHLLEYRHVLTQHARLAETISSQVESRVLQGRDLEIEVLSVVALAGAHGCDISLENLGRVLGMRAPALDRGLLRLINEHLVAERLGRVSGLHELRSQQILLACRNLAPATVSISIERVLSGLDDRQVQTFLERCLRQDFVPRGQVVNAVATHLRQFPTPKRFASCVQAFRVETFRASADSWQAIFDDEGVPPTDVVVVTHFATTDADESIFPDRTQRAIRRIRETPVHDLRADLIRALTPLPLGLFEGAELSELAGLLSSLAELQLPIEISPPQIAAALLRDSPGDVVRLLMQSLIELSPVAACEVVAQLGGDDALLSRYGCDRAWARDVSLEPLTSGQRVVSANYISVADQSHEAIHDAVVELAEELLAFAPAATHVRCRATDPGRKTLGADVPIAEKFIAREDLPSRPAIAWNQTRFRAALSAMSASSTTEYFDDVSRALQGLGRFVRRSGDLWARGKSPTPLLERDCEQRQAAANRLRPLAPPNLSHAPLTLAAVSPGDDATYVASMVPCNVIPRLFLGHNVAPMIASILAKVAAVSRDSRWELVSEAPDGELAELRAALCDLHDAVSERDAGRGKHRKAPLGGTNTLAKVAKVARVRAENRVRSAIDQLATELARHGINAQIIRRPADPGSATWPGDRVLMLLTVQSLGDWERDMPAVAEQARSILVGWSEIIMLPVRGGTAVHGLAMKASGTTCYREVIDPNDWGISREMIGTETLSTLLRDACFAADQLSSIVAIAPGGELEHPSEIETFDKAVVLLNERLAEGCELAKKTGDPLVVEVVSVLERLAHRIQAEAEAAPDAASVTPTIWQSSMTALATPDDDLALRIVAMQWAAEWDADPESASVMFEALDRPDETEAAAS